MAKSKRGAKSKGKNGKKGADDDVLVGGDVTTTNGSGGAPAAAATAVAEMSAAPVKVKAAPAPATGLPSASTMKKKGDAGGAQNKKKESGFVTVESWGEEDKPTSAAVTAAAGVADPLPAVSRDDVLDSCVGTTVWMLGIGLVLREGTFFGQGMLPEAIPDLTAALPLVAALHPPFAPSDLAVHAAVAVGAAAAVTVGAAYTT